MPESSTYKAVSLRQPTGHNLRQGYMTEVLWVRFKAVVPYRGLNDSIRFLNAKGGKSHPHGDLHMDAPLDGTKLMNSPLHDVSTGKNAVNTSFTMTIWKRRIATR
jgi:hypothetical protein